MQTQHGDVFILHITFEIFFQAISFGKWKVQRTNRLIRYTSIKEIGDMYNVMKVNGRLKIVKGWRSYIYCISYFYYNA